MSSFTMWLSRVVALLCFALVGAVWVPTTANAASGSQKWAVVSSAGVLVRGNGATGVNHTGPGSYDVLFASKLTKCASEASAGDPTAGGGLADPIEVTVAPLAPPAKGLHIATFDQTTATSVDMPFHVTTYCGAKPSFAVVAEDGTIVHGSHVVLVKRHSAGRYDVVFDHDVRKCAYSATIAAAVGETADPGEITVAPTAGNQNGVFVASMSSAGALVDVPFDLAVNCGAKTLTGVINADGTTARGTNVLASAKFSPLPNDARYEVIFDRDVTACAVTATIGSPTSLGVVFAPVTITTSGLLTSENGVFLFIKTAGGERRDEPFHITVTC